MYDKMYDNIYSTGFSSFKLDHELEIGTETVEVAVVVVAVVVYWFHDPWFVVGVVSVSEPDSVCQYEIARLDGRGIWTGSTATS